MNSAFKIANGGRCNLAYIVSKYVNFQPLRGWCPENFVKNCSYQIRQMIFHLNVSVMIKHFTFTSLGQICLPTSTW